MDKERSENTKKNRERENEKKIIVGTMVTRENNGKNEEQWKLEKNILLLFSLSHTI